MALWGTFTPYGDNISPVMAATLAPHFVAMALYLLYQWLLPKPLPGIAYNAEATKSLWGGEPALTRYLSANDFHEAQVILMIRTEFDKPQFLIDGLQASGDFHASYRMGEDVFRSHRQLRQDFGESALEPQLELLSKMTPSSIPEGHVDEPVTFAEASRSFFLELLHETAKFMERTTIFPSPQLSFWWWSQQTWYKKILRREIESSWGRFERLLIFADPMTGHHTTSSAMTCVNKYRTRYPNTQSKLRGELDAAIPEAVEEKRPPTFEELRRARLPYLEAVIEEARRLTPFVIVCETVQDTEILGRKVQKSAQCLMVNPGPGITLPLVPVDGKTRSATSKAAKPWGKWDESRDLKLFDPERWFIPREDRSVEFDATSGPQLGFGMGTRQCWGRRLAQLAIRTVIALVVWEFEMMEIPEDLGCYAGLDGISCELVWAFARFREITPHEF